VVDDDRQVLVAERHDVAGLELVERHPVGEAGAPPALDVQAERGAGLSLPLHDLEDLIPGCRGHFDRYHRSVSTSKSPPARKSSCWSSGHPPRVPRGPNQFNYAAAVGRPMCRLFGMLSSRPETAESWLVRSDRSLLAQSNVSPETAQTDGWGIAWFTDGGRTRVEKGPRGAFAPEERERFVRAAADASGDLVIGHLRHASNPLRLPPERLIGLENSQPFSTHTALFGHNGSIPFPTETRPFLGLHEPQVKGVNDSEVLFWLLHRNAEETGDVLGAYVRTVEDLVRVWQSVGHPKIPAFSGLNVLYSRGPNELWAFCLWTGDHGTGLFDPSRRYYEMTYQARPHRLIVGSEPFDADRGAWTSLPSGSYVRARREAQHVELTVGRIPIPVGLETGPPAT
jgi:predicted glutamine amidotransferase